VFAGEAMRRLRQGNDLAQKVARGLGRGALLLGYLPALAAREQASHGMKLRAQAA
jgi:hypothetical protein